MEKEQIEKEKKLWNLLLTHNVKSIGFNEDYLDGDKSMPMINQVILFFEDGGNLVIYPEQEYLVVE